MRTAFEEARSGLSAEFHPQRLATGVTLGVIFGLLEVAFAVSFAALIFSGEMKEYVSNGIGLMLFSVAIIATIIALFSSFSGVFGSIQDGPAAIMSVIAAAIIAAMPASVGQDETFVTIVAAMAITSLLVGVLFLSLGFLRSGGLVRFLPYPVIGGFLAGAGWLIVVGSISVMTGTSPTLLELESFLGLDTLAMWLPGAIFAVTLIIVLRRYQHALIFPAMIMAGVGLFYLVALLSGASMEEITTSGWLMGPFSNEALYRPLLPSDLSQVHWPAIAAQVGNIGAVMVVSVVALLLNASGIEIVFHRDMDLNRELRAAGAANIVSGLGGGMVGFHTLTYSALVEKSGVTSRITSLTTALVCLVGIIIGAAILSLFPRFIMGGLLMYIGLSFIIEWVFEAWRKLPKVDYFVVILILVIIAIAGFLPGVAIGLVAAIILFVLNYSRTNVIKHTLSGSNFRSRVNRESDKQEILQNRGEEIFILHLQGFIFFGTANSINERVVRRLANSTKVKPRFILLDFRQVTGVDSTALLSFSKMRNLAEKNSLSLLLSNLDPLIRLQFENDGFQESPDSPIRYFSDADYSLEWCENQLLADAEISGEPQSSTIEDQLLALSAGRLDTSTLIRYLEPLEMDAGQYLMRQGDPPDDLYFLEEGQVTAILESSTGEPIRLETMQGGQVLGEIGFYLGRDRTASVVVDAPSRLYRLTKNSLRTMEKNDPEAAIALQEFIVRLLSLRVSHLLEMVNALQR